MRIAPAVALLSLSALAAGPTVDAGGTEKGVEVFVLDDLGILPPVDDLYTASLGVVGSFAGYRFALYENLFTDTDAGLRFDETHLTASRAVGIGGWNLLPEIGGVRVGEGLFGQSLQNFVHRLIGRDELNLDYTAKDLHASLRFQANRPFQVGSGTRLGPRLELYDAFGLKRHAILGGAFDWPASRSVAVHGLLAARYSAADFAPLRPWMRGWAPAGEIGVRIRERVTVAVSYNAFGTEDDHLQLRFDWRID